MLQVRVAILGVGRLGACTAADALEALCLAEAASRSYRERRTVKLSEIN